MEEPINLLCRKMDNENTIDIKFFQKLSLYEKLLFYKTSAEILSSPVIPSDRKRRASAMFSVCERDEALIKYTDDFIERIRIEKREGISLIKAIVENNMEKFVKILNSIPKRTINQQLIDYALQYKRDAMVVLLLNKIPKGDSKNVPPPSNVPPPPKRVKIEERPRDAPPPKMEEKAPKREEKPVVEPPPFRDFSTDEALLDEIMQGGKKSKNARKKFDKEYQRCDTPDEDDPLREFYTSLYEERPDSALAISWLVERGVYEEETEESTILLEKYKSLVDAGSVVKVGCRKVAPKII